MSRREREIVEILHRLQSSTAAEVHAEMQAMPTYSAVRATLRILEEKGHVKREEIGVRRYVFRPSHPRDRAARSAMKRVLNTFFDDSAEKAVVALLSVSDTQLPQSELDRLIRLIEQSLKEGR